MMVTFVLYKTKCFFFRRCPSTSPPSGDRSPPLPWQSSPSPPSPPPGTGWLSRWDSQLSPGSHLDCQVEGGRVRLFLNCQAADSTNIGRHQVSNNDNFVNIRWTFSLKSQLRITLWYCSSHCPRCCIPNNSIKMFISESGVWPSLIALHRTGGTVSHLPD